VRQLESFCFFALSKNDSIFVTVETKTKPGFPFLLSPMPLPAAPCRCRYYYLTFTFDFQRAIFDVAQAIDFVVCAI